jgi:prepilin-type N-terminal cleavage/methylation domain-containing protein
MKGISTSSKEASVRQKGFTLVELLVVVVTVAVVLLGLLIPVGGGIYMVLSKTEHTGVVSSVENLTPGMVVGRGETNSI